MSSSTPGGGAAGGATSSLLRTLQNGGNSHATTHQGRSTPSASVGRKSDVSVAAAAPLPRGVAQQLAAAGVADRLKASAQGDTADWVNTRVPAVSKRIRSPRPKNEFDFDSDEDSSLAYEGLKPQAQWPQSHSHSNLAPKPEPFQRADVKRLSPPNVTPKNNDSLSFGISVDADASPSSRLKLFESARREAERATITDEACKTRGFYNVGNSCYMSAATVALIHCVPFLRSLLCDKTIDALTKVAQNEASEYVKTSGGSSEGGDAGAGASSSTVGVSDILKLLHPRLIYRNVPMVREEDRLLAKHRTEARRLRARAVALGLVDEGSFLAVERAPQPADPREAAELSAAVLRDFVPEIFSDVDAGGGGAALSASSSDSFFSRLSAIKPAPNLAHGFFASLHAIALRRAAGLLVPPFALRALRAATARADPDFGGKTQQDAHEYIVHLLRGLETEVDPAALLLSTAHGALFADSAVALSRYTEIAQAALLAPGVEKQRSTERLLSFLPAGFGSSTAVPAVTLPDDPIDRALALELLSIKTATHALNRATPVGRLFSCELSIKLECKDCRYVRTRVEPQHDLTLPLPAPRQSTPTPPVVRTQVSITPPSRDAKGAGSDSLASDGSVSPGVPSSKVFSKPNDGAITIDDDDEDDDIVKVKRARSETSPLADAHSGAGAGGGLRSDSAATGTSKLSLERLLQELLAPRDLELICPKCRGTMARATYSISELPRILVICVKRFVYEATIGSRKAEDPVTFGAQLDLTPHLSDGPVALPPPIDIVSGANARLQEKVDDTLKKETELSHYQACRHESYSARKKSYTEKLSEWNQLCDAVKKAKEGGRPASSSSAAPKSCPPERASLQALMRPRLNSSPPPLPAPPRTASQVKGTLAGIITGSSVSASASAPAVSAVLSKALAESKAASQKPASAPGIGRDAQAPSRNSVVTNHQTAKEFKIDKRVVSAQTPTPAFDVEQIEDSSPDGESATEDSKKRKEKGYGLKGGAPTKGTCSKCTFNNIEGASECAICDSVLIETDTDVPEANADLRDVIVLDDSDDDMAVDQQQTGEFLLPPRPIEPDDEFDLRNSEPDPLNPFGKFSPYRDSSVTREAEAATKAALVAPSAPIIELMDSADAIHDDSAGVSTSAAAAPAASSPPGRGAAAAAETEVEADEIHFHVADMLPPSPAPSALYDLVSVVHHLGTSLKHGHYITDTRGEHSFALPEDYGVTAAQLAEGFDDDPYDVLRKLEVLPEVESRPSRLPRDTNCEDVTRLLPDRPWYRHNDSIVKRVAACDVFGADSQRSAYIFVFQLRD